MTSKPDAPSRTPRTTGTTDTTGTNPSALPTLAEPPVHGFGMRFTSAPRGARLARRLASDRLDTWGIPHGTEPHDAVTLIVSELTSNAVRHGRVPGRDFELRLDVTAEANRTAVRISVTDTRAERLPPRPSALVDPGLKESGRGLLLVSRLAARWDWHLRPDGPGKTVWADYVLPAPSSVPGRHLSPRDRDGERLGRT
ncbi:ATP-binding protein [Streptomyces malaysiensis subsp. malaysiensis]|uniref:ATP-binding protein n=1 Tax=Streptomyces malaysiensis TaxID=92644 RepID=UPI000BFD3E12|nr:ATP-binding protein [Streptomyces malaysiensis]ATL81791.1 regulatory protein [Streptomyces malaysiensis]QDL73801.1 ATP-binding protein [Streptomyces malaysiensis]